MRFFWVLLFSVITLGSAGCIKHRWKDGVPPQPTPYPVLSLSTEKTRAVAAMVRVLLNVVPANAVACLSIDIPRYGEPFSYYPDSALLKAVEGKVKTVSERDCPPSYWNAYSREKPFELLKAPAGYVEPYHIWATKLKYLGGNQAQGEVTAAVMSMHFIRYCYAQRMSRHNWRASCPGGVNEILGP